MMESKLTLDAEEPGPDDAGGQQPPARLRIGAAIRARRQRDGLTLQALGDKAGLSVGYLSQIERDQATPSLGTLAQIAAALRVGVEYFIATPKAQDAFSRAEGRQKFSVDGSSIIYERISTEFPENELSSFIMHVPPGYQSEMVSHGGEEIILVIEGEITQWLDGAEFRLGPGDAIHFRSSRDHAWANRTDRPARLVCTGTQPLLQSLSATRMPVHPGPDTDPKPAARPDRKPAQSNSPEECSE